MKEKIREAFFLQIKDHVETIKGKCSRDQETDACEFVHQTGQFLVNVEIITQAEYADCDVRISRALYSGGN